jgi:hypothetical protein
VTIDLPHHLAWVDELYGGAWPAVDEDRLFDLARAWRRSAQGLREVDQDADWVARDVVTNNDARPIDAFGQAWRRSHFNHYLAAEAQDLIAETVHSVGLAVQSGKIAIMGVLALTATRLMHAKVNASYVPGSAAEDAFRSVAAGRNAIETTLRRLHQFVEEEIGGNAYRKTMEILGQIKSVGPARTPNYDGRSEPTAM